MADLVVNTANKSSKELIGQGVRAYILEDYNAAVVALSKASEVLVAEHGDDQHESLADVYLYYGKALLGLWREQGEALGDGVPNDSESDEEDIENIETEEGQKRNDEKKEQAEEKMEETQNGKENGENSSNSGVKEAEASGSGDADKTEEKGDEEEPTDLQVAWEVLELAKKIYQKQGRERRKNLAEAMTVLGEISLESENFESAINDLKEGLEIQKELFAKDSRTVAETYYKLGVAYSVNTQIDEAIDSFQSSLKYLHNRVKHLEEAEVKNNEIEEEIKEIRNLIPDVEEKITDMKSYKDETLQKIISAVTESKTSSESITTSSSASSSKPASDISHLVKRKRKLDDIAEETENDENPAKKSQAS